MVSYFSNLRASFNSPESIASKNKFLNKYKDSNIYESQACYICDSHDWNIINNIDRYGFITLPVFVVNAEISNKLNIIKKMS